MADIKDIHAVSGGMSETGLLEHLLTEWFPGRVAVSASLRARSVAALRLIADIDPSTPVIFCHAGALYRESTEYRDKIVELFGLTDIREPESDEATVTTVDLDHVEWVYSQAPGGGRVKNSIHLSRSLADFDCWISAAYHLAAHQNVTRRVDIAGRLVQVDPLFRWSREQVHRFMKEREIPFHKLAGRSLDAPASKDGNEDLAFFGF